MVGTVFGVIFYLGIASALPRSYFDYESQEDRKKVFSTSLMLTLVGACLQIILGYIFKSHISIGLFGTPKWEYAIFVSLIATALGFINQLFMVLLRFLKMSVAVSTLGVISLILNLVFTYILLFYIETGLWAPIWGLLITNLFIFLLVCFLCRGHYGANVLPSEVRVQLIFGAPTIVISCATMVIEWSDRFFLNKFLTINDVGVYTVGYKFASVVTIFLIAPFVQIWNPVMMENRENKDFPEFVSRAIGYYFIAGCVAVVTASLFMSEVLYLIIPKKFYFDGLAISPIIMFGLLLNGINNFVSAGLFYDRKIHKMMFAYCFIALLYVGLSYFLIPLYGYQGAAWGSFAIYSLTPFLIYKISKKHFSIVFNWGKVLPCLVIIMFVVLWGNKLEVLLPASRFAAKLALLIVIYSLVYVFILEKNEIAAMKVFLLKLRKKKSV